MQINAKSMEYLNKIMKNQLTIIGNQSKIDINPLKIYQNIKINENQLESVQN